MVISTLQLLLQSQIAQDIHTCNTATIIPLVKTGFLNFLFRIGMLDVHTYIHTSVYVLRIHDLFVLIRRLLILLRIIGNQLPLHSIGTSTVRTKI